MYNNTIKLLLIFTAAKYGAFILDPYYLEMIQAYPLLTNAINIGLSVLFYYFVYKLITVYITNTIAQRYILILIILIGNMNLLYFI